MELTKNFKGQTIGFINEETKVYVTSMKTAKHFMKIFGGFGIDDVVISRLNKLNIDVIKIPYTGRQGYKLYKCFLSQFLKSDKKYINRENGEYNPQTFLSIDEMTLENKHAEKQVTLLLDQNKS